MKYAMLPEYWDGVDKALSAEGCELTQDLGEAEFLVYNGSAANFPELPENIRWVQLTIAGIDAFFDAGIITDERRWSNASKIYGRTVAESAMGLLLAQLHHHPRITRAKSWEVRDELDHTTTYLLDSTVAILGAGGIGEAMVPMLKAFGCRVIAVNRSGRDVAGADVTYPTEQIDRAYAEADHFVVAAPHTAATHHMINAESLAKMHPHSVVVNVGRGPLVDTEALIEALEHGTIAGAGLDVTEPEPLPESSPLWGMDNVVITPHVANTIGSIQHRMGPAAVANFKAWQAGETMPTEVTPANGY